MVSFMRNEISRILTLKANYRELGLVYRKKKSEYLEL